MSRRPKTRIQSGSVTWVLCAACALCALLACKKKEEASAASASSGPVAGSTPAAWQDKISAEKFRRFIDNHACDCTVTESKKQGDVDVVSWRIHARGDDNYQSNVTTITAIGSKEEGDRLASQLSDKYGRCVASLVGNKVLLSTRLVELSRNTSAVELCTSASGDEPMDLTGLDGAVE